MGHIQKIILIILTVPFALFPGGLIAYVLLYEAPRFEYSMLIPIGMTFFGICSFYFHLKTKSFYRLYKAQLPMPKVEPIFWFICISFGMSFVVVSSFLHYTLANVANPSDNYVVLIFSIPMFVFGVWTVVEAFYLYKLVKENQTKTRISEIDEIKGQIKE